MRSWLISLKGAITLSLIALLTILGRGFMDWRYEYSLQAPTSRIRKRICPGKSSYLCVKRWKYSKIDIGQLRDLLASVYE